MPNNEKVIDPKPNMASVVDTKPNLLTIFGETAIYMEDRILPAGMWMGFGALTYPTTIEFETVRS